MTHSSDSGFSDPYNTFKKGDVSGGYYEHYYEFNQGPGYYDNLKLINVKISMSTD